MTKEQWAENTAKLFYQIFSCDYDEKFLKKLLSGGGGNSALGSTLYHTLGSFVHSRISKTSIEAFDEIGFSYTLKDNVVRISKANIKSRWTLFSNNAKGAEKRRLAGKEFHFDHNPPTKMLLHQISTEVKKVNDMTISFAEKISKLKNFMLTGQTLDLITVEQDDERTKADRKKLLTAEERDEILQDVWYDLIIE
ncbi:MAG: hypothetical protein FWB72_00500 [Firmicutes bacterium]|nr:hypothetical protein [Bacillota bacterium]